MKDEIEERFENAIWNLLFKQVEKTYEIYTDKSIVAFVFSDEYKRMKRAFEYFKKTKLKSQMEKGK